MAILSSSSPLWTHSAKSVSPKLTPYTATRFSRPSKPSSIVMAAPPRLLLQKWRRQLLSAVGEWERRCKIWEREMICWNDDLEAVLEATPKSRWNDLVFFQNGMLEPWLQSKGLNDADQVLAYFAVSKLGEPPTDGKTDTNPEGLTAAYGKWASAIATRLLAGGLSCKVLDKEAFQKQMLEKLIWICAFMLVGARHPGATVGVVEKEYRSEDRLCAYARAVAHFPTAVKEFKWRNGWFYSISRRQLLTEKPDPCPLHTAWLKELKVV
ncbi:tubby-like protein 8-like [Hibiscus syriacus]|uniref:Tubby-like protein 8-like n=1 Tax=Hibiscus syriacus TaxID=106335 RepID=A0A6A3A9J6_HIBSY|nr:tubby-like protein 8-like [Hibiscus syriacus]